MINKVFKVIIIILIIIIIFGVIAYLILKSNQPKEEMREYIPEEEISEEQSRQTIVNIYFKYPETNSLVAEARLIDAKLLLNNPYNVLMELLLQGPKNENLVKIIPEDIKLVNIKIENGIVIIDFSQEFSKIFEYTQEEQNLIIESINLTLKELNEVEDVKINVLDS